MITENKKEPDNQHVFRETNGRNPAIKETINRMKDTAKRLQNGHSGDIEYIGRAVSDLCFLIALMVEADSPTAIRCQVEREKIYDTIERRMEQGRGINLPTGLTIIMVAGMVVTLLWKLLSQ